MSKFTKVAAALATIGALASGSAHAYLQNWYMDANGATGGTGDAVKIQDNIAIAGSSVGRITVTATGGTGFNFAEQGVLKLSESNTGQAFTQSLFATYNLTGNGTFGSAPGTFDGNATFTGGSFTLWVGPASFATATDLYGVGSTNHTAIASFNVTGDYIKNLDDIGRPNSGNATNNSPFSITGTATSMPNGYFYMPDLLTDIAGLDKDFTFAFVVGNATTISPSDLMASEFGAEDLTLNPAGGDFSVSFFVNHGGQARLAVPEPSSIALLGLGLLGVAGGIRRRKGKAV